MYEFHTPVLLKEVIEYLKVREGKKYIDATVGGGGHAVEIVKRGGILLGIDCEPEAIAAAKSLIRYSTNSLLVRGNFRVIDKIAHQYNFDKVAGVLFDLGMSSWQIEKSGKGFSFQKDEPLDMRMDPTLRVTAVDLINGLTAKEFYELFSKFGEEKFSLRIADSIVKCRRVARIETTKQLSDLICACYAERPPFVRQWRTTGGRRGIHPATRVFQALRIAVNDELNNLQKALPKAVNLLEPSGRLVVISFHSLEDRIVKQEFKRLADVGQIGILTNKLVRPTVEEIKKNPRARAAKLRAAERR